MVLKFRVSGLGFSVLSFLLGVRIWRKIRVFWRKIRYGYINKSKHANYDGSIGEHLYNDDSSTRSEDLAHESRVQVMVAGSKACRSSRGPTEGGKR